MNCTLILTHLFIKRFTYLIVKLILFLNIFVLTYYNYLNNVSMIADNSNFTYDSSFFQCYICMSNVKKPRMCPSCSKLACESCLRKWIQEGKSQCPHCRKTLPLNGFADCQRFVNDIKHLISTMDSNQKTKQKCKQHKLEMQYFCQECKQAICSDCGMFGVKHKGHQITHLSKIYQENKNKILNQLARFDQKIESYRKNGFYIKLEMQKLMIQIGQKKSFIEQYFLNLIQRLQQQFREKKLKHENQLEENTHEIELLQAFRDQICNQLERKSQKEIITNSDQLIQQIYKLCQKQKYSSKQYQQQQYCFQTIQQIVPKYQQFKYQMKKYLLLHEGITYSEPYIINGIEWRLKIYPRGNGVAKDTHISVFLEMSKAYTNQNKYQYKIQLINQFNSKDSIVREYSSKFDIGECWGYNQFVPLVELQNGFLDVQGSLHFNISVRNPTYKSLVRDQQNYLKVLQNKLKSNQQQPTIRNNEIISKLSKKSQNNRLQLKKTLLLSQQQQQQQQKEQNRILNSNSSNSNNNYPNQQYYNSNGNNGNNGNSNIMNNRVQQQQQHNNSSNNNSNTYRNNLNSLNNNKNNNKLLLSSSQQQQNLHNLHLHSLHNNLNDIDNMIMLDTDSIQDQYRSNNINENHHIISPLNHTNSSQYNNNSSNNNNSNISSYTNNSNNYNSIRSNNYVSQRGNYGNVVSDNNNISNSNSNSNTINNNHTTTTSNSSSNIANTSNNINSSNNRSTNNIISSTSTNNNNNISANSTTVSTSNNIRARHQ